MKVTRTILADVPPQLAAICKTAGYIRADIWRRYGALGNVGVSASAVRTEVVEKKIYDSLPIDGTIRAETTKDIVNDILTYKAAAKLRVRQAIAKRSGDENERKRLYTLLKRDEWLADPFLHRQMRKHFRHGKSEVANQFIVRSDRYSTDVIDGNLVITVRVAKKYGDNIMLTTTTSGKNVDLTGSNLRVIVKDGFTEIHYATETGDGRECGDQVLGIDKGCTEAFADSDGDHHGQNFGKVMTDYSDKVSATGKQRNKLHALEKKHRENAALNVLARIDDCEISRFTPYKEVRRILLARSPAQLSVKRVELGTKVRQPTADKSHAQICATF